LNEEKRTSFSRNVHERRKKTRFLAVGKKLGYFVENKQNTADLEALFLLSEVPEAQSQLKWMAPGGTQWLP